MNHLKHLIDIKNVSILVLFCHNFKLNGKRKMLHEIYFTTLCSRKSFYDLFQSWLQRSFLNNAVESCHRIRLSNIAWNSAFYSKVVPIAFNLIKVFICLYFPFDWYDFWYKALRSTIWWITITYFKSQT